MFPSPLSGLAGSHRITPLVITGSWSLVHSPGVEHVTVGITGASDARGIAVGAGPVGRETVAPEARYHKRFRWRGGIGVVLLLPAIVSIFSAPLIPEKSWVHLIIRSVAWFVFLAGAGLRFWATLYIGGRKERALVTDGPYSICRHPLYLGSLLIGASAGLFLESPLCELALGAAAVVYAATTIPIEETILRSRHEVEHADFRARTGRFWPGWRNFHSPPQVLVDVRAIRLEFSRALRWVWIPILGEALTFLRYQTWWPHVFRAF